MTSSWLSLIAATAQPPASLVPATPSAAPDYYCTWNLQGYVCSYGVGAGSNDLRLEINEDNLFGSQLGYKVWGREQAKTTQTSGQPPREVSWIVPARYQGWLSHYPMLHADLSFVMDDSWDIPRGPEPDGTSKRPHGRNYDNEYLATMSIAPDRFPSFKGNDERRMKRLVQAVKKQGWRSLGGWVCAQDPICLTQEYTGMENTYENSFRWSPEQEERFWKRRLSESQRAGFDYWKVDWGNKDSDEQFRRRLSQWGREVAPDVIIEHASFQDGGTHHPGFISFSQTIRSYDVNNQIAQAQTLQRLYDLGQQPDAEREGWGIINCEDEAYIAAGLGCAIGVMRHPYVGAVDGGWQQGGHWGSVYDQTWSATGYIRMILTDLLGMRFTPQGLTFNPDAKLLGEFGVERLSNLRYLNGRLDISVSGKGDKLVAVKVNGKTQPANKPIAPANGTTQIDLIIK